MNHPDLVHVRKQGNVKVSNFTSGFTSRGSHTTGIDRARQKGDYRM